MAAPAQQGQQARPHGMALRMMMSEAEGAHGKRTRMDPPCRMECGWRACGWRWQSYRLDELAHICELFAGDQRRLRLDGEIGGLRQRALSRGLVATHQARPHLVHSCTRASLRREVHRSRRRGGGRPAFAAWRRVSPPRRGARGGDPPAPCGAVVAGWRGMARWRPSPTACSRRPRRRLGRRRLCGCLRSCCRRAR